MSALGDLLRWESAGGTWQVVHRDRTGVTVSLLRCDGGEEAARFTSDEPALLAWLQERPPRSG